MSSVAALAAILGLSTPVAHAASVGDNFNPIGYDVYINYNNFSINSRLADPLTTEESFAGSQWKTFAFTRAYNSLLSTGFADAEVKIVPSVFSTSTVNDNYFKGLVHVEYATDPDAYPHSMKMLVSGSPDFSSSDTQECEMVCKTCGGGEYYFFDIPARDSRDYYKFEIDVPKQGPFDGWFQISEIFLYKDGDRVKINLDNDNKLCNIMSLKGDLHVKATEYNAGGAIVNEDLTHVQNKAEESDWTNKVAGQDEVYSLRYPTTPGNYIVILAKTIGANGIHSPEKRITVNESGLVNSICTPIMDEMHSTPEIDEWYDLSGRRLEGPVPGINIHRQTSKTGRIIKN